MAIDTHCHVQLAHGDAADAQLSATERGSESSVSYVLCSTRPCDWHCAVAWSRCDTTRFIAAVGVHPWFAGDVGDSTETIDSLLKCFSRGDAHVLGEVGLDKVNLAPPTQRGCAAASRQQRAELYARQKQVFSSQIALAARLQGVHPGTRASTRSACPTHRERHPGHRQIISHSHSLSSLREGIWRPGGVSHGYTCTVSAG